MAEEPQVEEQESGNPFSEFPEQVQNDINSLMWLGYLEDSFEFCGHSFTLATLRGDDELNSGLVVKEYAETFSQARAYAWAKIALALVAVDGDANFCPPIGPDKREFARTRFKWVTERWYWPVAEFLYSRYTALELRQIEAIEAVQGLSTGSPPPSTPSPDSLNDKGDSPEEN